MKSIFLVPVLLGSASFVFASTAEFQINSVQYSGTGCPSGRKALEMFVQGDSLDLAFYEMDAEPKTFKFPGRKQCKVSIPISISPGYKISLLQIQPPQYKGFAITPLGTSGMISVETSFRNAQGTRISQSTAMKFRNGFIGPFIHTTPKAGQRLESTCGENVTFEVDVSLIAGTNLDPNLTSLVSLDDAGRFQFQVEPCTSK